MMKNVLLGLAVLTAITSCKKDPDTTGDTAALTFKVQFDNSLPRLGNLGEEVSVPAGNAAHSPTMHAASIHYIELAKDSLTPIGSGLILYHGAETNAGGDNAVDFNQAVIVGQDGIAVEVDWSDVDPGEYKWVRVSLTYQNYDVPVLINQPPYLNNYEIDGRLASFVGFNNYLTNFNVKDSILYIHGNKEQGYWAFESSGEVQGVGFGSVEEGDGAGVTVVNPIASTSPVPDGSCVVTGRFDTPFVVTTSEDRTRTIALRFSTNQSFEWQEVNADGKFEPGAGENVVDMGLRGLHPVEQ